MLGPIVGHVTATTARLWLQALEVSGLEYRTGTAEWNNVPAAPDPDRGGITVVDLAELAPSTEYQYRFTVQDREIGDGAGRFTTLATNPDKVSFAFGSCHEPQSGGPQDGFERWSALADAMWAHDFLLLCGDQIYEHGLSPAQSSAEAVTQAWNRQYEKFWSDRRFREVTAFSPTYMIWDDHEIRDDWGSLPADWTGQAQRQRFAAASDAYERFQNSHNPPGYGGSRSYGFRVGPASFYVLDLRGERGKDPQYPVLGKDQFNRFLDWLSGPGAGSEMLFVVTPVPVAHVSSWALEKARELGKQHDHDTADLWNDERNRPDLLRLLDTLFHMQCDGTVKQVFILGGDVHVATACQIRSDHPQHAHKPVIYQFTSSPISSAPPGWAKSLFSGLFIRGIQDLGAGYAAVNTRYLARRNFGEVKIRRDGADWVVEFSINAEGGGILNPWATVRC